MMKEKKSTCIVLRLRFTYVSVISEFVTEKKGNRNPVWWKLNYLCIE